MINVNLINKKKNKILHPNTNRNKDGKFHFLNCQCSVCKGTIGTQVIVQY